MREGMTKLRTFPRSRLLEVPLCRLRTHELGLYQALGDPTAATDPSESDPRLYWDIEWTCGLVMALQYHQITEELEIQLDAPDVGHALRHLGVPAYDMWLLRVEDPTRFATLCDPPNLDWEVWRETPAAPAPAGERFKLRLSQRDADCWAAELADQTGRRHWARRAEPSELLEA
jgi:hypothetical protein